METTDLHGNHEHVAGIPGMPMGLGWLPDGTMLIVSSQDGTLLRRDAAGTLTTHADLAALTPHPWSDMHVDDHGDAYIGFDFAAGFEPTDGTHPGTLAHVAPDGTARTVADDLAFPTASPSPPTARPSSSPSPTATASPPTPSPPTTASPNAAPGQTSATEGS